MTSVIIWIFKSILLCLVFVICFTAGGMIVGSGLPEGSTTQPGLVPVTVGILIIAVANVSVVTFLIVSSRWGGWKLAISLAFVYYGVATLLPQIETWYFLSSLTVPPQLLPRLFLMGIPTAFVFVPLAVWILAKDRSAVHVSSDFVLKMGVRDWLWRVAVLAIVYVVLYWCAGYFIAWQNPELRAFYGQPGDPQPFLVHTLNTLMNQPSLFGLQLLRGAFWVLCALPVVAGSKFKTTSTGVMVGLFFSVPQNVAQILPNPLMPLASVRLSHLIETTLSTFVFGVIVVLMLHWKHCSGVNTSGKQARVSECRN